MGQKSHKSRLSMNEELWRIGSKILFHSGVDNQNIEEILDGYIANYNQISHYQILHFNRERERFVVPSKVNIKHFEVDCEWFGWHSTMRKSPKDRYFDCLWLSQVWTQANCDYEIWSSDINGVRYEIKSLPHLKMGIPPTVIRIQFIDGRKAILDIGCPNTFPRFLGGGAPTRDRSIGLDYPSPQVETGIDYEFGG